MSHFSVMVIGADVEKALAPFHEFECTGENDEYVKDVDVTEEVRVSYEKATTMMLRDPDGVLHGRYGEDGNYNSAFLRDPTPEEDAAKMAWERGKQVKFTPEGWEEVEVPTKDRMAFLEYCTEYDGRPAVKGDDIVDTEGECKYGYVRIDRFGEVVSVIRRTNPSAKWDWYQIGGRFRERLLLKDGSKGDTAKVEDIDWDGMIAERAADAAETYDSIIRIVADRPFIAWKDVYARVEAKEINIDEGRTLYNDQPVLGELYAADAISRWGGGSEVVTEVLTTDRDTYIRRSSEEGATTWALLFNGDWRERGEMGWFGISSATPESTQSYADMFWATVRELPHGTVVTVVDCHI